MTDSSDPRLTAKKHCSLCGLPDNLCICSQIPSPKIECKTKLHMVVHATEITRPTNTGQLTVACLEDAECHLFGSQEKKLDIGSFLSSRETYILYPDGNLLDSSFTKSHPDGINLIVPDGNWSQASKIFRKIIQDPRVKRLSLVPEHPSTFKLRRDPRNREIALATMESVALALSILEAGPVSKKLQSIFDSFVENHLIHRGK